MPTPAADPTLSPPICHGLIDIQSWWFLSSWCFDQNASEQIEGEKKKQSMFCEILITHQTRTEYLPFDFAPWLPHYLRELHVSARRQKKPLSGAHLDSIYPLMHFPFIESSA